VDIVLLDDVVSCPYYIARFTAVAGKSDVCS